MSGIPSLDIVVERLVRTSRSHMTDPYGSIDWPASVDPSGDWFFSPELSSLYGTDIWQQLDDEARHRLAFFEAVNFFSLNVHGERILMQGIAERLYRDRFLAVSDYLHHFLDEENKHSVYFGQFCRRYARVYPSRHPKVAEAADARAADVVFFARVLAFEEVADRYNVAQANDRRLHALARQINLRHHADESRHLVFGRHLLRELCETIDDWPSDARAGVSASLEQFIESSWREYYNPNVYADAGLDAPWDVAHIAWSAPAQRVHRDRTIARCRGFLTELGLLEEHRAAQ